jgi:3-oxoacyl-[acyl-carrier protein] reductase
MDLNLKGKRALVCGSTQGIGKAAAIELANLGAAVTLMARNKSALKRVLQELPGSQQGHSFIVADFSDPMSLKEALPAGMADTAGIFNILVNNTGGPAGGPAHKAEIEEFQHAFTQHLVCNQILVQALLDGMKASGYGRIINVISTSVKQPLPGLGVSNTIRGAVANWAKTLANELGPYGITVNNVLPGATATARLKSIVTNKAEKTGHTAEEIEKQMLSTIPLRRFADAREVANAIAFLASPAAAYINGINMPVDGGRTSSL